MKKITVLLFVMAAALCGMQLSAQPAKGPSRSAIYPGLPSNFITLGTYDNPNHLYYSTQEQNAVGNFGGNSKVHGVSIIGEVDGKYYSSTYAKLDSTKFFPGTNVLDTTTNPGAGFIAAMKVEGGILGNENPVLCNSQSGTERNSVRFSARVERAGEYAARIIYTLTNEVSIISLSPSRTVSLGVYADIMIGDNDSAAVYCLRNEQGKVYGLDMKYKQDELAEPGEKVPVFTAIFDAASGVTPVDDWWFGQYRNNFSLGQIAGVDAYDSKTDEYDSYYDSWYDYAEDPFYKVEGGKYDSGMGFCWKNITLARGESVELSFLVSVSEIDIDEPEPDPEAEYHVEVYNTPEWNDLPADHPAHVWGYYKHPFDWTSHMEYMVDGDRGTGEWTAIPGELTPNSEFDLNFNLNFDPDVADIHTLKLRLADAQGNYTYLTDLNQEWEDVRTIPMTANPETHYYDGTPKTFVVSIGGVFDYPFEYTEPGTYDFSIYGDYDMGTIGINTVEFSIVRRVASLNVVVPEDCVYDGNEHPATYTCDGDGDVIVTYKNTETGEISTEAPVEPGTYEVFAEVTDGPICDGIPNASYGEFTISKKQPVLNVVIPENCVYDGNEHPATATLTDGDGTIIITYKDTETGEISTDAPVEPGTYEVFVEVTGGEHFDGIENKSYGEFTIDRRPCEYTAILPDQFIKQDGQQHGATINTPEGSGVITVIYKNLINNTESTTPPSDLGIYAIILSIDDSGEYYYGMEPTVIWTFEIYDKYPTALDELTIGTEDNGAWYTIDGRRVAAPNQSGIYIHNGKKYIVK